MYERAGVLLFCAFSACMFSVSADINPDCPLHWLTLSYESLNCRPIIENGAKCPTSYDCSAFESRDKNVCQVMGKTYNISDTMDKNLSPCFSNCTCAKSENGIAFTNCTYHQCPWDVHIGCDLIQRKDTCCSTYSCGKREFKGVTCTYQGDTYGEGEEFGPGARSGKCKTCTCQEGFRGELEEPYCHYADCKLDVHHSEKLNKGCTPVFIKPLYCCPFSWRCPAETDEVIQASPDFVPKTSASCRFGKLTIPAGATINNGDTNFVDCICDLPPFLTCIRGGSLF